MEKNELQEKTIEMELIFNNMEFLLKAIYTTKVNLNINKNNLDVLEYLYKLAKSMASKCWDYAWKVEKLIDDFKLENTGEKENE